jgi:Na+/proline symporter
MAAKDGRSARLTPIIGAYPKAFVPLITVLPGMAAVLLLPGIGGEGGLEYNQVIPGLMEKYLPQGVLGVAVTGLLAAFMAGMAANVSSFNAVFTYDIWQDYLKPGRTDRYYLTVGRLVTVAGVLLAIATALIASSFSNIQNYLQTLFSFFNVPLFCAFIIGMFWHRASKSAGFWGILTGTLTAAAVYFLYQTRRPEFPQRPTGNHVGIGRRVRRRRRQHDHRLAAGKAQDRPRATWAGVRHGNQGRVRNRRRRLVPLTGRPGRRGAGRVRRPVRLALPHLTGRNSP